MFLYEINIYSFIWYVFLLYCRDIRLQIEQLFSFVFWFLLFSLSSQGTCMKVSLIEPKSSLKNISLIYAVQAEIHKKLTNFADILNSYLHISITDSFWTEFTMPIHLSAFILSVSISRILYRELFSIWQKSSSVFHLQNEGVSWYTIISKFSIFHKENKATIVLLT